MPSVLYFRFYQYNISKKITQYRRSFLKYNYSLKSFFYAKYGCWKLCNLTTFFLLFLIKTTNHFLISKIIHTLLPCNFPYRKYNNLVMQLGISKNFKKKKGECIHYEKADKISCSSFCSGFTRCWCIHDLLRSRLD